MRIICVGAGSIGMLVTAKLAAAGADIALIAHTERQAAQLNAGGLVLAEGERESVHNVPAASFEYIDSRGDRSWLDFEPDWVLLTVKQKHLTDRLLATVSGLLGRRGRLLCFQNGIGHVEKIASYVPIACIDLAVTTEGARKQSAAKVAHTGRGTTWLGTADPAQSGISQTAAEKAQKLMENMMNEAGFRTYLSNQMNEIVWNKLLINSVINPLTALLRIPNGELPATDRRRSLMRELLTEGIAVAEGSGVKTRENLWEQILDVCSRTAGNASSMLQDVTEGRRTEIDWINGAMLEAARKYGIPMPAHETIYKLVKAAEPEE